MASMWSGIPLDLLLLIAQELRDNNISDLIRLSSVCKPWRESLLADEAIRRSLTVLSSQLDLPKLMLPKKLPNTPGDPNTRDFIHMSNGQYFRLHLPELEGMRCCGSGHGWLVIVRDKSESSYRSHPEMGIRLFNPMTREQLLLPSHPSFSTPADCFVRKAIIIGDPSESEDYTVAIIFSDLMYWVTQPRNAQTWLEVERMGYIESQLLDIAHDQGVLYGFGENLRFIKAWKMNPSEFLWRALWISPILDEIVFSHPYFYRSFRSYCLQASVGNIYGVSRLLLTPNDDPAVGNSALLVFRLNLCLRRWERVKDLGDRCLFLGDNTAMALSPVPPNSGFRPNCVYFCRCRYSDDEIMEIGEEDWSVYDLGDGTYQRFTFQNTSTYNTQCPPLWLSFNPNKAA